MTFVRFIELMVFANSMICNLDETLICYPFVTCSGAKPFNLQARVSCEQPRLEKLSLERKREAEKELRRHHQLQVMHRAEEDEVSFAALAAALSVASSYLQPNPCRVFRES